MPDFKASLLREKFTITDKIPTKGKEEDPVIALSNRIVVPLVSPDGIDNEIFVIRTQNMHSCARLAAAITKEFFERGSISQRATPVPWKEMWTDIVKGYERDWNPDIWCAVYYKGRVVYENGERHPFLDIIEQCDSASKQEYAESVFFAEQAFSQAGKDVTIDHDSNVAFVILCTEEQAKGGVIIRSAAGTTTFNYVTTQDEEYPRSIHVHTTLTVAAAFLEGVQLAFQVGLMNKKQQFKLIEQYSDEDRKHSRAKKRLANLNRAISSYEKSFNVNYRPDRPAFKDIVDKAENFSIKILKPEIEEKIAEGELDAKDWVF